MEATKSTRVASRSLNLATDIDAGYKLDDLFWKTPIQLHSGRTIKQPKTMATTLEAKSKRTHLPVVVVVAVLFLI